MSYLTADNLFLDRLRGIVEPVEIRDPDGKLLGHYSPVVAPEVAALYEKAQALFGPEELAETKRTAATERGQGHTLAEVMEYLRSLERKE